MDGALARSYRERAQLGRDELARRLGVTERTVQRLENEGVASAAVLRRLGQVLDVPLVALLRRDAAEVRERLRSSGLGPSRPPTLAGRDAEVALLCDLLTRSGGPRVVVVDGAIGIGKTALAQAVAQSLAEQFEDGVVWLNGELTDVARAQRDVAVALGFDAELATLGASSTGHDGTQAFTARLWRRRRLVILDDAVEEAHLDGFLGDAAGARLLVTTRFKSLAMAPGRHRAHLARVDDDAIVTLLAAGRDRLELERAAHELEQLLAFIAGVPGVAQVASTALRREPLTTPGSWLAQVVPGGLRTERTATLAVAYFQRLERQVSRAAWELFATLGGFGTEPVPLELAATAAGTTLAVTRSAASELLDAHVVELHPGADDRGGPWLRLAGYAATAAGTMLAARG